MPASPHKEHTRNNCGFCFDIFTYLVCRRLQMCRTCLRSAFCEVLTCGMIMTYMVHMCAGVHTCTDIYTHVNTGTIPRQILEVAPGNESFCTAIGEWFPDCLDPVGSSSGACSRYMGSHKSACMHVISSTKLISEVM